MKLTKAQEQALQVVRQYKRVYSYGNTGIRLATLQVLARQGLIGLDTKRMPGAWVAWVK